MCACQCDVGWRTPTPSAGAGAAFCTERAPPGTAADLNSRTAGVMRNSSQPGLFGCTSSSSDVVCLVVSQAEYIAAAVAACVALCLCLGCCCCGPRKLLKCLCCIGSKGGSGLGGRRCCWLRCCPTHDAPENKYGDQRPSRKHRKQHRRVRVRRWSHRQGRKQGRTEAQSDASSSTSASGSCTGESDSSSCPTSQRERQRHRQVQRQHRYRERCHLQSRANPLQVAATAHLQHPTTLPVFSGDPASTLDQLAVLLAWHGMRAQSQGGHAANPDAATIAAVLSALAPSANQTQSSSLIRERHDPRLGDHRFMLPSGRRKLDDGTRHAIRDAPVDMGGAITPTAITRLLQDRKGCMHDRGKTSAE